VASLPGFWQGIHDAGGHFDRPDDFAAFSDAGRAEITITDASELADLIESVFADYIAELKTHDGKLWLYGAETTPAKMCGLIINETVLHGRDLAVVTGAEAPMYTQDEANLAVGAMMDTTPFFIDEDKARAQPDGVYRGKFRGGKDFTWTKRGDQLIIDEGAPAKADAHLNADPATFLLASLGRIGQVRAALSGKMISYGRKPWRFLGLGTMAVDGV